ncbi:hypothetical protein [Microcoleus sp. S13_B4]|uniref:hypothetical protein n=1 Tax=Microcoleus sp. S13_B4 TaxID=3055408 RepID=UPI002FD3B353
MPNITITLINGNGTDNISFEINGNLIPIVVNMVINLPNTPAYVQIVDGDPQGQGAPRTRLRKVNGDFFDGDYRCDMNTHEDGIIYVHFQRIFVIEEGDPGDEVLYGQVS